MSVLFSNSASTTLSAGVGDSATSITVADGSVFPAITGSDYFYLTLEVDSNPELKEIVKCTARSGNTLTIARGQDSTSARTFSTADKAQLRLTAAGLNDVATQADTDTTYSAGTGVTLAGTEFSLTDTNAKLNLSGGTLTGNLSLGDNDKATFGAGSDLQIYHDGTTSVIEEIGSGDLRLKGTNIDFKSTANETYAYFQADGASILYHNGSDKLTTTSTGINVTGQAMMDGLTVDGDIKITQTQGGTFLKFDVDGTNDEATVGMDATDLIISVDPTNIRANSDFIIKNDGTETFRIASNAVATFAGTVSATGGNSTNWNTAYSWGDHSTAGYLTSYTDTNTTYSVGDGGLTQINFTSADHAKLDGIADSANNYSHPSAHAISFITGLQSALDGKVDDSQVLTNVPSGAVFTDTVYSHPSHHAISVISGLQAALDAKVDDSQVLTNVPAGALFTDTNTTYSVQDGELSQNNFTNADHTKLDGIAASANNYVLPSNIKTQSVVTSAPASGTGFAAGHVWYVVS